MEITYGRTVDDALAIAEHEWRVLGVDRRDRVALAADLRLDLEAAAADGVSADRLLGPDVRGFARRLAHEAGAHSAPYEYRQLVLTALAGTVPGVVAGYILMNGFFSFPVDLNVPVNVFTYYGSAATLVIIGALVAVWIRMRDVPRIRRTVAAMALLMPVAGAAITPVTMGFAAWTGYSSSVPIVLIEMAIAGSTLAGAIVLARRWALRDHDHDHDGDHDGDGDGDGVSPTRT